MQLRFKDEEEKEIQLALGDNYKDYLALKKVKVLFIPPAAEVMDHSFNFFTYLSDTEFVKPVWTSYSSEPRDIRTLIDNMPLSMGK